MSPYSPGNILTFNTGYKSLTFGYSNGQWKDQLTSVTKDGEAHTITYDAAGNPLVYYNGYTKDHHMTWTEGRRLKTYYYNGKTYAYEYNADGLRTKKTNPDGTYIEYLIADGRYLGEIHYTASNVIDLYIRYNYDESGSVIGISLWDEQTSTAWDTYYFVKNLQGDVLRIYRGSDSVHVATYDYDSWGNVTALGSVSYDGRTLCELNPFRYRGYYFDNESYFYYLQSRYYDPAIGRFINADVLASTGQGIIGCNMYAYCLNNPVNLVDHLGNRPGDWFDSMDDAARDAAEYMGPDSFENCWEYAATIYAEKRTTKHITWSVFDINILGVTISLPIPIITEQEKTQYTYVDIYTDHSEKSVAPRPFPPNSNPVAFVHTHPLGSNRGFTRFSDYIEDGERKGDIPLAQKLGIYMYVYGPNGVFLGYNPAQERPYIVGTDLPKSPKKPWLE